MKTNNLTYVFTVLFLFFTYSGLTSLALGQDLLPGERQNGGDPILVKFHEGIAIGRLILAEVEADDWSVDEDLSFALRNRGFSSSTFLSWLTTNQASFVTEFETMRIAVATKEQKTCAVTGSSVSDLVYIDPSRCIGQIESSTDAAWILFGEASHHIRSSARAHWSVDDENAFAATVSSSAQRSFADFRIDPARFVRRHRCEREAQQSERLKSAIEKLNIANVKRIVETEQFPVWDGLVDRDCKLITTASAIAAGSPNLKNIEGWLTEPNKAQLAMEILRYLVDHGAGWDLDRTTIVLEALTSAYHPQLMLSKGSYLDGVFRWFFAGRKESGLSANLFVVYVLGYDRSGLHQELNEALTEVNLAKIFDTLASRGYTISEDTLRIVEIHGVDYSAGWASELLFKLLSYELRSRSWQVVNVLVERGVKLSDTQKKKLIERELEVLRTKTVEDSGYLGSLSHLFDFAEQNEVDFNMPIDAQGGRFCDLINLYKNLYARGAQIHRELAEHRTKIVDYAGNRGVRRSSTKPEVYLSEAAIMSRRATALQEILKLSNANGRQLSGAKYKVYVPGPHGGTNSQTLTYGAYTYLLLAQQNEYASSGIRGPHISESGYLCWPTSPDIFRTNKVGFEAISF